MFPRDQRALDDDPRPGADDDHGTACAGVACADGRFGASGVAPKARLMPIRMPLAIGSQRNADAFVWAVDHGADVISCSWGPEDGDWWRANDPRHQQVALLLDNMRLAIEYAIERGRGGKGCVVFFAAGNGNESVDNDGYASYPKVVAVAACNDRGRRCVYSDFGKAVFCSFPSSDFGFPAEGRPDPLTPGIWTTDRTGHAGYNPDAETGQIGGDPQLKYTNAFGGTSSACPGAAGVAALVLARNPSLRWDEVRDVLRRSCDRIDPQNGQYDANGRSPRYGYGRLNAETAVQLARAEQPANRITIHRAFDQPIRDFQTSVVTVNVGETAAIGSIKVAVDIEHTFIGDLVVRLVPPAGLGAAAVTLHNRAGGAAHDLKRQYDKLNAPGLAACEGKSPQRAWTLEVADRAAEDEGAIKSFGLELALTAAPRAARPPKAAASRQRAKRRPGRRR